MKVKDLKRLIKNVDDDVEVVFRDCENICQELNTDLSGKAYIAEDEFNFIRRVGKAKKNATPALILNTDHY